jgi:hypothetical protein
MPNLTTVPALDLSNATPEQIAAFMKQAQEMMAAVNNVAKAQAAQHKTRIDALRYEIFTAREEMKECASCAHNREVAAAAHEELKSLVLTGASKVKFSEDEETTFRARRNNEREARKAAKAAK